MPYMIRQGALIMTREPKILIWDIETALAAFWTFSCGDQVLRHGDLMEGYFSRTHIMTISYMWLGEKKAHSLNWGESEADEAEMIRKFDEIVKQADLVIGKNSHRFDNKHLNAQRLFFDLPAIGNWVERSEDLEQLLRRNFNVQSQSLDYWSKQLGIGGKISMSKSSHWTPLAQGRLLALVARKMDVVPVGALDAMAKVLFNTTYLNAKKDYTRALKDMETYNKKDVVDTAKLLQKVLPHVKMKFNYGAFVSAQQDDGVLRCRQCASENVTKHGFRFIASARHQRYICHECGCDQTSKLPKIEGVLK